MAAYEIHASILSFMAISDSRDAGICFWGDATFNIIGEEAVQTALEAGVIDEKGIIKIQEIPIALVLL